MNPISCHSPVSPRESCEECFDVSVYRTADSSLKRCADTIDSADSMQRKKSICYTNWIIQILQSTIHQPLNRIPIFPYIGTHVDHQTAAEIEQVYQQHRLQSRERPATDAEQSERNEIVKRVVNILNSFFHEEAEYLLEYLEKARTASPDEAMQILCIGLGSMADGIACEVQEIAAQSGF